MNIRVALPSVLLAGFCVSASAPGQSQPQQPQTQSAQNQAVQNPNGRMPSSPHLISPDQSSAHITVQEQMRRAREQREIAEAQRKGLGATIRARLAAERQQRLAGEGRIQAQAAGDRERVQEEARQIVSQVQTHNTGGFHSTNPGLDWRNIATNSGQLNAVEATEQDPCLTFDGRSGALYPVTEFLADRMATNSPNRVRAAFFANPYYYRDGERYERRTILVGGQRYYQFVRR